MYIDVGHRVKGPVTLPTGPWKTPLLLPGDTGPFKIGCKFQTGRFREFTKNVSLLVDALNATAFDHSGGCYSTRVMLMDTERLPSCQVLAERIKLMFEANVDKASKFWEQEGLIQAMFWNETGEIEI